MMTRRHILTLLGAPAIVLAAPGPQMVSTVPGSAPPWARLVLLLDHRNDLAKVGKACLSTWPALERCSAERVCRALAQWTGTPPGSPERILAALPEQVISDFESGAIESVGGWQISHTEILLAVLASKSEAFV